MRPLVDELELEPVKDSVRFRLRSSESTSGASEEVFLGDGDSEEELLLGHNDEADEEDHLLSASKGRYKYTTLHKGSGTNKTKYGKSETSRSSVDIFAMQ